MQNPVRPHLLSVRKYFPIDAWRVTNCPRVLFTAVQYFMTKEHVCYGKTGHRNAEH